MPEVYQAPLGSFVSDPRVDRPDHLERGTERGAGRNPARFRPAAGDYCPRTAAAAATRCFSDASVSG
ncbi:hypothetical protein GCM10009828_104410 [Actinoplanes couchii]